MDLREVRFRKRRTQWDICSITGIPQSKLSLIERGYIIPSDQEKQKISEALGYSVEEIQWYEEKKVGDRAPA